MARQANHDAVVPLSAEPRRTHEPPRWCARALTLTKPRATTLSFRFILHLGLFAPLQINKDELGCGGVDLWKTDAPAYGYNGTYGSCV